MKRSLIILILGFIAGGIFFDQIDKTEKSVTPYTWVSHLSNTSTHNRTRRYHGPFNVEYPRVQIPLNVAFPRVHTCSMSFVVVPPIASSH